MRKLAHMAELNIRGAVPEFELPHRLRRAREYAELHQAELAAAIGVGVRSLGKYESGESVPKRHVVMAWALRTGCDYQWLLTGSVTGDTPPGVDTKPTVTEEAPRRKFPAFTRSGAAVRGDIPGGSAQAA